MSTERILPGVLDESARRELRLGLARTRRYLLSHHAADELYKCHRVRAFGRELYFCARCSGIYPGIALGLLAHARGLLLDRYLLVIAVLPAFALLDWSRAAVTDADGSNAVRTVTGLLLGFAYGFGALGLLAAFPHWPTIAVGVAYAVGAAVALVARNRLA